MRYTVEELKALVESGDKAAIDTFLYKALEKEDVALVQRINADVRSELDRDKDIHANKSLETWKTNNLEDLVKTELSKHNPTKTPAELEVEKLRAEIESERAARTRETLKSKALASLGQESLTVEEGLLERLIGNDEETTENNLNLLKGLVQNIKQSTLDGVYKDNGTKPPIGNVGGGGETVTPLRDLANAANLRNK